MGALTIATGSLSGDTLPGSPAGPLPSSTSIPMAMQLQERETREPIPPMTTHWTVPASCTWTYNAASEPVPGATGAVAWLDIEPDADATTLSCYPDGMFIGGRTGVFSPATCPSGWTTATVVVNTEEDRNLATTTAICCSSEYSLVDTICKRSVPTVLAVPISYNKTASTHTVLSSSTTTLYSATIALYTIMAMFQDSDKVMLGIGDEDDIDDEFHSSGLSVDAKIGIGVGSAVAGLLLFAGAIFLALHCRRRSRKKNARSSHEMGSVHMSCRNHRLRRDDESFTSTEDHDCDHREHRHSREPPPAYEATPDSSSLADSEVGSGASRDEIQVLRAQKEAIQKRIEELESVETDDIVELPDIRQRELQQQQQHEDGTQLPSVQHEERNQERQ